MKRLTLYVYPDGRRIVQTHEDLTESARDSITKALEASEGKVLIVDGYDVDIVNVQPSVEDRLVAIEERLGMRPVTVK